MNAQTNWLPAEPDLETVCKTYNDPIYALSQAEMPAIILRNAYAPEQCHGLIERFTNMGLMRNEADINSADKRTRIDIGTSLGNRGGDKAKFWHTQKRQNTSLTSYFMGSITLWISSTNHSLRFRPEKR